MIKIEIKPLKGIEIENIGTVNLGQPRSEIENLLGIPPAGTDNNRAFYDNYELRIDYDSANKAEFIEFLFGPSPEKIELTIYGNNPFKMDASELVELLTQKNNGEIDNSEAEMSYAFLNISVGIWRDAIPEYIEETITENKQNGDYEHNKSWLLEELEKSKHFWTIGIGKENYYSL